MYASFDLVKVTGFMEFSKSDFFICMSPEFQTRFSIQPLQKKIKSSAGIFLTGSCFSDSIADYLQQRKFNVLANPFGVLYNPVSIGEQLLMHIENTPVAEKDIFEVQGLRRHFNFHSRKVHPDLKEAMRLMQNAVEEGHLFLQQAATLIITFGTSVVYRHIPSGKIVANNHKLPAHLFEKNQLEPETVVRQWTEIVRRLKAFNPDIQIIFTVSPVRHIKDGMPENGISKSVLLWSLHLLRQLFPDIYYFPSYEIMLDELRDYRFYAEDMIHPNATALRYIQSRFTETCIDPENYSRMQKMEEILQAMAHKPFFPATEQNSAFKEKMLMKVKAFAEEFQIDMTTELHYFSS